MSASDMFYHCTLLNQFFESNKSIGNPGVFRILKKIIAISRHYLESGMKTLALNPEWVCQTWPNLDILKRCFSEFQITGSDIANMTVVDFFNFNNDIEKYSFHDTSRVHPRFVGQNATLEDWPQKGKKYICTASTAHQRIALNESADEWVKKFNNIN